jgi:hypothetical protein
MISDYLWRYPAYVNLLNNMVSPSVSYPPVYGVECTIPTLLTSWDPGLGFGTAAELVSLVSQKSSALLEINDKI